MIIGIFTHFFALETTLAERQFFRALAKLIGRRAARLSACGIAAIVSKMGYLDEGCSVGADGSLYNVRQFTFVSAFRFFPAYCPTLLMICLEISGIPRSCAWRPVWYLRRERTVCDLWHFVRVTPTFFDDLSNITTHHAEDGSGVGSAIIAGKLMTAYLSLRGHLTNFYSHDQNPKGRRLVRSCLIVVP